MKIETLNSLNSARFLEEFRKFRIDNVDSFAQREYSNIAKKIDSLAYEAYTWAKKNNKIV